MTKPIQALPKDFIWGVSGSAFQSEGGNLDSNWNRHNAASPEQDRYADAIDFRHRYREDVGLARDLGINTFRFGVNWARVEPRKGQFDPEALAYYDDLIKAQLEAGLAPLLTLDHFVYPGWVQDQGGWTNPHTVTDFVDFSRMIAQRYIGEVKLWLTFNEAAFFMIIDKKIMKFDRAGLKLMSRHVVSAHCQIYDLIHALDDRAMVSSNIVWCGQGLLSSILQWYTDRLFLNQAAHKMDCIAFDYYYKGITRDLFTGKLWDIPLAPSGLAHALKKLARRYPRLPILVAENGMPTEDAGPRADGVTREDVLRDSVYWVQRAKAEGVNVIGYMYWSMTDNFEWGRYVPRFGLYTVNVKTDPELKRIPTAAVPAFREITRNGGVGSGYKPVLD